MLAKPEYFSPPDEVCCWPGRRGGEPSGSFCWPWHRGRASAERRRYGGAFAGQGYRGGKPSGSFCWLGRRGRDAGRECYGEEDGGTVAENYREDAGRPRPRGGGTDGRGAAANWPGSPPRTTMPLAHKFNYCEPNGIEFNCKWSCGTDSSHCVGHRLRRCRGECPGRRRSNRLGRRLVR